MNIVLILIEMIIAALFTLIAYKKYRYEGLYLYCIIAYILSIVISVKNIELLNVEIPLGIVFITSIYIVSNLLVQDKGLESAKKLFNLLFITGVSFVTIAILGFSLTSFDTSFIPDVYSLMFMNKIRIVLATACVPFVVLWLNANSYYFLKREKNNLIISNAFTSLAIFFIDAIIFSLISFIYVLPINEIFVIILLIYIIKIIMGIIGIPLAYIVRIMKDNK